MLLSEIGYFIIDGSWLASRKFYAGSPCQEVVDVIANFSDMNETYVVWDSQVENFRKQIWPGYKSNRPERDPAYYDYCDSIIAMCPKGVWHLTGDEGEGDDAIYSCARAMSLRGDIVGIVSCDKDFFQVVSDKIWFVKFGLDFSYHIYSEENLKEETGLSASEHLSVQALAGDASDCYPGVRGIGEKTAAAIIKANPAIIDDIINGDGDAVLEAYRQDHPKLVKHVTAILDDVEHLKKMYTIAKIHIVSIKMIKRVKRRANNE